MSDRECQCLVVVDVLNSTRLHMLRQPCIFNPADTDCIMESQVVMFLLLLGIEPYALSNTISLSTSNPV